MAEDSGTAGMLATARAHDSGEAGQWWHKQWAAQAAAAPAGEAAGRGHVQMAAWVCWGSVRRGVVNGSRGAGQKCWVCSREAKWEGEMQRCSTRGK